MERELAEEDAKHVPMTPPVIAAPIPASPRASPTSRAHDEGGHESHSHESKKAKIEVQKKFGIGMLRGSHEKMIRVVKIGEREFHTMNSYEHDPSIEFADDALQNDDIWHEEDVMCFNFQMCQKSCGQMLPSMFLQVLPVLGLTNLQTKLKSHVCLAWVCCKSVVILMAWLKVL
jgi:hypothetical protein